MPERPLIISPRPEDVAIPPGHGGGGMPPKPAMGTSRRNKFRDKFTSALNYIQNIPGNINPEMALVIETIGKIGDFHRAVRKIEELEWLVEADLDEVEIEEDLYDDANERSEAKKAGGRLYLISSNKSGLEKIFSMWKKYSQGERLGHGYGIWETAFDYINELRFWNEKDRVKETGILKYWKEEIDLKKGTASTIGFEVELHFHESQEKSNNAEIEVSNAMEGLGGKFSAIRIPDIGFHAMKAILPVDVVDKIHETYLNISNDDYGIYNKFIKLESVKYFRPVPQQVIQDEGVPVLPAEMENTITNELPPVIALFDGMPMVVHDFLENRMIIEDPDNFSEAYAPEQRKHGTSMASLICHEDLENPERKSLSRKIYVRPIMKPSERLGQKEEIPEDEFAEDIVERSVKHLFPDQGGSVGAAPFIKVINLSIGNINIPFLGEMSSWARLLDWLSWKHKVLFIVSAGNFSDEIELPAGNDKSLKEKTIKNIYQSIRNRKILSPAESINCLTVGASSFDYSKLPSNDTRIDVLEEQRLMSEYSRLGSGYRRSIKPDILVAGGKQVFAIKSNNDPIILERDHRHNAPGQKFAYVGASPEDIKNTSHGRGTSNAAALTTHFAGVLYEVIEDIRSNNSELIPEEYDALLIKSLLVHGASWGEMRGELDIVKYPINSRRFKRTISQFLGYGEADFSRVMECTAQRVTMLGFGKLEEKSRHRFALPIPNACKGIHYQLIVTLTYFTPIIHSRFNYRSAKVFFDTPLSAKNRQEADFQQTRNGTVQHEILDLSDIQNDVEIFVQCNADAVDSLDVEIPYALSITLETQQETIVDIYSEIRQQIETRVRT